MGDKQYTATGKGPEMSRTSKTPDAGNKAQDAAQLRQMGAMNPSQTNGAGISPSPAIAIDSQRPLSSNMDTSVGSGSRPGKSMYPIETSAPVDARTMGRVDKVDYLK